MAQKINGWMVSTFVLAGLIIGIGVGIGVSQLPFLKNALNKDIAGNAQGNGTNPTNAQNQDVPGLHDINITPVTAGEHIIGAQNPKVTFVEYSDPECPFCKKFHDTMQQMVKAFPNDVQWVYRNFPLDMHSKAKHEVTAMECAAEIGGNDVFWKYLDRLEAITPANNGLDPKELNNIADFVKLDKQKFADCLKTDKYAVKVQAQISEAERNGGDGTPFTVVLAPGDKKYLLKGHVDFQPLSDAVKKILTVK